MEDLDLDFSSPTGTVVDVQVDGIVAMWINRKKSEISLCLQAFKNVRVAVVGRGFKVTAKDGFRIVMPDGKIPVLLVAHHNRLVVTEHLGKKAEHEEKQEDQQGIMTTPVGCKTPPTTAGERCRRSRAGRHLSPVLQS